jgi:hypothetical protein
MKRKKIVKRLDLPDEMILNILEFMDVKNLSTCLKISKQFFKISNTDFLWKQLYEKELNFKIPKKINTPWKSIVKYKLYFVKNCPFDGSKKISESKEKLEEIIEMMNTIQSIENHQKYENQIKHLQGHLEFCLNHEIQKKSLLESIEKSDLKKSLNYLFERTKIVSHQYQRLWANESYLTVLEITSDRNFNMKFQLFGNTLAYDVIQNTLVMDLSVGIKCSSFDTYLKEGINPKNDHLHTYTNLRTPMHPLKHYECLLSSGRKNENSTYFKSGLRGILDELGFEDLSVEIFLEFFNSFLITPHIYDHTNTLMLK